MSGRATELPAKEPAEMGFVCETMRICNIADPVLRPIQAAQCLQAAFQPACTDIGRYAAEGFEQSIKLAAGNALVFQQVFDIKIILVQVHFNIFTDSLLARWPGTGST